MFNESKLMDYYRNIKNYFNGGSQPNGMEYGTVNTFNSVNIPYGDKLLPSNALNRQGTPGPGTFGVNGPNRMGQVIQPLSVTGPQNSDTVKNMNANFLFGSQNPSGVPGYINPIDNFSNLSLQADKSNNGYSISLNDVYTNGTRAVSESGNKRIPNYYINLAGESLHQKPDLLMMVFFSDENINYLRNTVVQKVKQITADSGVAGDNQGVTIQTPNMDDFFYYMVNIFQNYKIQNGSICFVALKQSSDLKSDIAKLNTNVLQEYVSKMVSQINMYIYYYKDASQLPEQLSLPVYTSSRSDNKVLEYNTGFQSGNSLGMARYNQVGNVL